MENVENQEQGLHPATAGQTLMAARKAAGLSRADIATRTKVAERHIIAIEEDRFEDLAARTYAVGFSRAYARALGLDEKHIAELVRVQLNEHGAERPAPQPSFEPGDPARVPSLRLAWVATGAIVLAIGLIVYFWSNFFSPEGELPSLLADNEASEAAPSAQPTAQMAQPSSVPTGPVVLTSGAERIWVKVTDAEGNQLFQKELAQGETYTVPNDGAGAQLRTARPDALRITVGGREIPQISEKPETVSGVSLAGADLLARAGVAAPAGQAAPAAAPSAQSAAPTSTPSPKPTSASLATPLVQPGVSEAPAPRTGASVAPAARATRQAPAAGASSGASPRASASPRSTPATAPMRSAAPATQGAPATPAPTPDTQAPDTQD